MRDDVKPSLEQLKHAQANDLASAEYWERHAATYRASAAQFCAQIAAEEGREAKAKEWPQEDDLVWMVDSTGPVQRIFQSHVYDMRASLGMTFRTREECQLAVDFLRSRPRGWLLAMAKMGEGTAFTNTVGRLSMLWHADKLTALTDDERKALLRQG